MASHAKAYLIGAQAYSTARLYNQVDAANPCSVGRFAFPQKKHLSQLTLLWAAQHASTGRRKSGIMQKSKEVTPTMPATATIAQLLNKPAPAMSSSEAKLKLLAT